MTTMNNPGNPTTTILPLQPYLGGAAHLVAMSPPDTVKKCIPLGRNVRCEFVVMAPAAITAFTIHYGRWVTGRTGNGTTHDLDGWLEDGTRAVTGATVGELFAVEFTTKTDPVGVYVDGLTGVAAGSDPEDGFLFWVRAIP